MHKLEINYSISENNCNRVHWKWYKSLSTCQILVCQMILILIVILKILISSNCQKIFQKQDCALELQLGQISPITQHCYENIGCLNSSEKWFDIKLRPVNLKPLDRHTLKTTFILLSLNSTDYNTLNYDTIVVRKESIGIFGSCITKQKTTLLIHDFTSNGYTGWIKHFAKTLLKIDNTNVIAVDWESGAEPPYDQAIANARVVALEIANILQLLEAKYSIDIKNVHIFGHGVGAHIAGYVGKIIKTIRMITALDPSGPRFQGMPSEVRLDKSDARYVEVLHTDAYKGKSQGTKESLGHVDFFINGAKRQPRCNESGSTFIVKLTRNELREGTILPDCSHKRAFKYYLEALRSPTECEFIGFESTSFDNFTLGRITYCEKEWECAKFGDIEVPSSIPPQNRSYYLITNEEYPFCVQPSKIIIHIENNPHARKVTKGYFDFIFITKDGTLVNSTTYKSKNRYENGKWYTSLNYGAPKRINDISEARVRWIHKSMCLFCNTAIYMSSFHIYSIYWTSARNSTPMAISMCPTNGTTLPNKVYVEFQPCAEKTKILLPVTEASTTATGVYQNETFLVTV